MVYNIAGALIAAASGAAVAFLNYIFSKRMLIRAPEKYAVITVARQLLQVGFLVLVYFISMKTTLAEPMYPLVGAVIGMTLPMIFFTKKLLSINEETVKKAKEKQERGEGDG